MRVRYGVESMGVPYLAHRILLIERAVEGGAQRDHDSGVLHDQMLLRLAHLGHQPVEVSVLSEQAAQVLDAVDRARVEVVPCSRRRRARRRSTQHIRRRLG